MTYVHFSVERIDDHRAHVLGNGHRWFVTTPRRAAGIVAALNNDWGQTAFQKGMREYRR